MPEEKKTETPKTQTQTQAPPPNTPIGATQEQQDITAEQQEQGQGPTTLTDDPLTDLELKEMNTLTETPHEDLTDEQKND
jgi:hypothetical protein